MGTSLVSSTRTEPAITPDTASSLLGALSRLIRAARSASRHTTDSLGATATETAIMKTLARAEAEGSATNRPGDLAEATGVAPSVVSRAVARLEHLGLVHRVRDAVDARSCHILLTDHGRAALAQAQLGYAVRLADALGGLTDDECRDLTAGMTRLEQAISLASTTSSRAASNIASTDASTTASTTA